MKEEKNKRYWFFIVIVMIIAILAVVFIYMRMSSAKREGLPEIIGNQEEKEPKESEGSKESEEFHGEEGGAEYPLIAAPGFDTWIDGVIVSEGIYCICTGEKYGFMTEDGKMLMPVDCDDPFIYDIAYPFHEGLACVCIGGKYGYIDINGEVAIPLIYDRAAPFMEGLAYFAIGDSCGFMDGTGSVIFELECDSVSSFQEGLAYFSVDGQYGYIDKSGQIVIAASYDDAEYFRDGLARVRKNEKYGVIGRDGSYILKPEYDSVRIGDLYIQAQKGERYEYFDAQGKRLAFEAYDHVYSDSGYIRIQKNGKQGLADAYGTVIFEPVYDRLIPVPGQKIVLAADGENWGMMRLSGEVLLPFQYSNISYMPYGDHTNGGMILVSDEEGKVGSLDVTDLSWVVPCKFDSIDWYSHDRAIVGVDGKYGVVDREGNTVVPVEYSEAGSFRDGTIYVKERSGQWMVWRAGEAERLGDYDRISRAGNCYMIEKDGRYGFLNESGDVVLEAVYDSASSYRVLGNSDLYIASRHFCQGDVFVKTGESADTDVSGLLLKNEITPMAGAYWEFVKNSFVSRSGWSEDVTIYQDELNGYRTAYKLYDLGHTGKPVLYFYAEPYVWNGHPMSYSGFYGIQNGQVIQLLSGYECGGSSGGDYVILQYDKVNDAVMLGSRIHMGGFGGNAYGGEVYDDRDGETEFVTSFMYIAQSVGNYADEELLEHAELFYGGEEQDIPFTRETILKALDVTEYNVDGEQCTVEAYREIVDRYRELSFLN